MRIISSCRLTVSTCTVLLLIWSCRAFSLLNHIPMAVHQRAQHHRAAFVRSSATLAPLSEPPLVSKKLGLAGAGGTDPNNNEDDVNHIHRLDLDSQGNLRLDGPTVLLNGLTPSVWSASRPSLSDGQDSLFLHTSYSKEMSEHESKLGDLVACQRLLACSRVTRYWMGPKVGTSAKDVPFDTQFLMIEVQENGPYALMLPLVDNGFRASLHYGDEGSIEVLCLAESGDASVKSNGMRALYVAVGDDPYKLIQTGFRQVADATGTFETLDRKQLPPSVDQFGWCTWDAFYSKVTPEGVLKGVNALREAGVPPQTIILDDGWQQVTPSPPDWKENEATQKQEQTEKNDSSVFSLFANFVSDLYGKYVQRAPHGSVGNVIWSALSKTVLKKQLWKYFDGETDFNRQLSGFPANQKFETNDDDMGQDSTKTLKGLVSKLKRELGVKNVLCWHALHGYWRGVSEELGKATGINVTNIIPKPSQNLLRLEPQLGWDPVSLFGVGLLTCEKDLAKFYELLHAPLVEAGVDGVKVDVQSGVSAVGGGVGGGPHLARMYTNAMEDSVSKRFVAENGAANCINCMCHSTENLYRYKATSVARASDDFYPRRPESHTVHLVNVAYNSLFIGEICLPDWDMFHSQHESAGLHAAARAIGGCPVYVSDAPGNHNPELLRKLVLPDGSVLRAKLPGRPTRDCLFVDVGTDGKSALKVWNQNDYGGVVGAFHVQGVAWNFKTHENEVVHPKPPPLTVTVKPHDIETLRGSSGPFVAWRQQSSTLEFLPSGDSEMTASLNHRDWEIFTIAPLQIQGEIMWGPIGLVDMLNSGGAILEVGQLQSSSSPMSTTTEFACRGPGRVVAFSNRRPSKVLLDDTDLAFTHDADNCELTIMLPSEASSNSPHRVTVQWG